MKMLSIRCLDAEGRSDRSASSFNTGPDFWKVHRKQKRYVQRMKDINAMDKRFEYNDRVDFPRDFACYVHKDAQYVPVIAVVNMFIELFVKQMMCMVQYRTLNAGRPGYASRPFKTPVVNISVEREKWFKEVVPQGITASGDEFLHETPSYNTIIVKYHITPLEYLTSYALPFNLGVLSEKQRHRIFSRSIAAALAGVEEAAENGLLRMPMMKVIRPRSTTVLLNNYNSLVNYFINPFYSDTLGTDLCQVKYDNMFTGMTAMGYGITVSEHYGYPSSRVVHYNSSFNRMPVNIPSLLTGESPLVRSTGDNIRDCVNDRILTDSLRDGGKEMDHLPVSTLTTMLTMDRSRIKELLISMLLDKEVDNSAIRLEIDSVVEDSTYRIRNGIETLMFNMSAMARGMGMEVLVKDHLHSSLLSSTVMDTETLAAMLQRVTGNVARQMSYEDTMFGYRRPCTDFMETYSLCKEKVTL